MFLTRRLDVTSIRAIREIDQCFSSKRSILKKSNRSNFHLESRPDILAMISLDDDSPKHVISACIVDVMYREIYGYARPMVLRRALGILRLLRRVKARAGSDAQKSTTAFFPPSLPRRVAPHFCAAFLSREYFQFLPFRIRATVFTRPRLLTTPPPALRRARSVYASCIRVGEVRDPRVISGLSRGTYINPSSPSTYISLSGIAQELVEISSATM